MTHFVTCPDCGASMRLVEHPRKPGEIFYGCSTYPECRATHGAHPDGRPLGRPADKRTRSWRIVAHEAFDQLWQQADQLYGEPLAGADRARLRSIARARAYRWLAQRFGVEEIHIGALDADGCQRVLEACEWVTAEDIRTWAKSQKESRS